MVNNPGKYKLTNEVAQVISKMQEQEQAKLAESLLSHKESLGDKLIRGIYTEHFKAIVESITKHAITSAMPILIKVEAKQKESDEALEKKLAEMKITEPEKTIPNAKPTIEASVEINSGNSDSEEDTVPVMGKVGDI